MEVIDILGMIRPSLVAVGDELMVRLRPTAKVEQDSWGGGGGVDAPSSSRRRHSSPETLFFSLQD